MDSIMVTGYDVDVLRVRTMQAQATAQLASAVIDLNKQLGRLHDAILLATVKLTTDPEAEEEGGE